MTPKYWGPSVWGFLHTLAAKITDEGYIQLRHEIYNMVYKILVLLPCPECSYDATTHFKKVPVEFLTDRTTFFNTLYLLHNKINVKLKKPLYNARQLSIYSHANIINAYNNFSKVFNTTTSRLMTENLHRRMFVGNLHRWLITNIRLFISLAPPPSPLPIILTQVTAKESSIPNIISTNQVSEVITILPVYTPIPEEPVLDLVSHIEEIICNPEDVSECDPDTNYIPLPINAHILEPSVTIEDVDTTDATFGLGDIKPQDEISTTLPKKRGRKKKV